MLIITVAAVVLGLCFLGLGFNIFFRKNGKFPETEIGQNREMKKRGIRCAKEENCCGCVHECPENPTQK